MPRKIVQKNPSAPTDDTGRLAFLRRLIDKLVIDLGGVHRRRMFGCDAWFVNGNIFCLALPDEDRIGVRLTDPRAFAKANALRGSAPFGPGGTPMKHWVLLPRSGEKDEEQLEKYLALAHGMAATLPPKEQKSRSMSEERFLAE